MKSKDIGIFQMNHLLQLSSKNNQNVKIKSSIQKVTTFQKESLKDSKQQGSANLEAFMKQELKKG